MLKPSDNPFENHRKSIDYLLQGLTDKGNIYGRLNAFGATISTRDRERANNAPRTDK